MFVRRNSLRPIAFGELKIFDYTATAQLDSSMALIEVPVGASHAEAWSKRSDKYYLVVDGEVRFSLAGEVTTLGPGDFCLVKQGQRFSYANESPTEARLVLVHTPNFDLDSEVFVTPS